MPQKNEFEFRGKIWIYDGPVAWHFASLPKKLSRILEDRFGVMARGFGSLPVSVRVGMTSWQTSIFPDSKAGTYMLPIKNEVRKKEGIRAEGSAIFFLTIRT